MSIDNPYKLWFTVRENGHNGLWMISVEGIQIETAPTEDEAWDWIERTWAPFPGDSLKEIEDLLIVQLSELKTIRNQRFTDDPEYHYARLFQRMAELANAGLRIALLARTSK